MDSFVLKQQAAELNVKAAEAQAAVNKLDEKKPEAKKFSDVEDQLRAKISDLEQEIKILKIEYKPEPVLLSPTEFQLKQELVKLGLEINNAYNVLTDLAGKKSEFIGQQKIETLRAIKGVYKKSKQYLSEATLNLNEIVGFNEDIQAISKVAEKILDSHKKDVDDFNQLTENTLAEIAKGQELLDTQVKEIIQQRKDITEQRAGLERTKTQIEKDKKLIESRQESLKTAYEILKKKSYGR